MKIVITGHTSGIGEYLYEKFFLQGYEVVGVSRQTGYDLSADIDRVVEVATGCDLFINNTSVGQIELLERLNDKVQRMVVMGSIAGDYHQLINNEYSLTKRQLQEKCRELSLRPNCSLLHLKISMLEDAVSSDNLISFKQVYNIIDFWIDDPVFTNIDFDFKLTAYTLEKIKEKYSASQDTIDFIINSLCSDSKKTL